MLSLSLVNRVIHQKYYDIFFCSHKQLFSGELLQTEVFSIDKDSSLSQLFLTVVYGKVGTTLTE